MAQLGGVDRGARTAPLSYRQEQLWLFDRLAPSAAAYGLAFSLHLTGKLDTEALEGALDDVIEAHVALRTVFPHEHETGEQVVQPSRPVRLTVEDAGDRDAGELRREIVDEELRRGFDVNVDAVVRFRLLRHGELAHELLVITHYLVMDPRSGRVLGADLAVAYAARVAGDAPTITAPALGQYAQWQREWTQSDAAGEAGEFWQRTLAGWEDTELPVDRPRPKVLDLTSETVAQSLPDGVGDRVAELAAELDATVEDVLLTAFFVVIARHTASSDLVVGLPRDVAGPFDGDRLVADTGNLVPVRAELATTTPFAMAVRAVAQRRGDAEAHRELPFKLILERMGIEPDPGRLPLVGLGFEIAAQAAPVHEADGLQIATEPLDTGVGTFELSLAVALDASAPRVTVRYANALYQPATAARLARRYIALIAGACAAPETAIGRLPFAEPEERAEVCETLNGAIGEPPATTIHDTFAAVARDHGDRVAIASAAGETTYAELDDWSNRIAHSLIDRGVAPGAHVPILFERGAGLVAAILGVLKAGAAYVPIDLSQPEDRVAMMVEDCGARVALASPDAWHLVSGDVRVVEEAAGAPSTAPELDVLPEALAYIIYTSGSTGRPKGVLVEHRNVTNFVRTVQEMFSLSLEDRVLQFASAGFDVSVFEIFGALLTGARSYVVDDDQRSSIEALDTVLVEERITVIDLPPAIMELLEPERYPDLRVAFVGGEAFSGALTTSWARGRDFYNGYGPTETTVTVVAKLCEGEWASSPPIGRAMANHRAYVLDADGGLQPPGAVGELAISGLGVGRGYLGRPDLTAERFRPDPYGPAGSRMYLTGDLAVWDEHGELAFLGRIDRQVKVRGIRIELGEVETALQSIDGVARAVADVAVDPERGTLLVAYVVPSDDGELQLDAVRAALGTLLPPPMVPSVLVPLDDVPLTQSGKVDRRALPPVEFVSAPAISDDEDGSSTPTERTVRDKVFAPLLGQRIGNHTNFFGAGGTSLQAIRIASRVKAVFDVDVPIADFFAAPTVVDLAALVDRALEQEGERRNALAETLDMVEGLSDEELAEALDAPAGDDGG